MTKDTGTTIAGAVNAVRNIFLSSKEKRKLAKAQMKIDRANELMADAHARIACVVYRIKPWRMKPDFYGIPNGYMFHKLTKDEKTALRIAKKKARKQKKKSRK